MLSMHKEKVQLKVHVLLLPKWIMFTSLLAYESVIVRRINSYFVKNST